MIGARHQDVIRDGEVLDELRSSPDLLAIADAVHATLGADFRRHRTRVRAARTVGIVAAGATALALLLVQPWSGGLSLVDRALAALPGRGSVVHAVLRTRVPGEQTVDLRTGRSSPETSELEFWYDEQRGVLHTLVRRDGHVVGDILSTPAGTISSAGGVLGPRSGLFLNPTLVGFAAGYRRALERDTARRVEAVPASGVVWLQAGDTQVALDRGLRPVSIRPAAAGGLRADRRPGRPIRADDARAGGLHAPGTLAGRAVRGSRRRVGGCLPGCRGRRAGRSRRLAEHATARARPPRRRPSTADAYVSGGRAQARPRRRRRSRLRRRPCRSPCLHRTLPRCPGSRPARACLRLPPASTAGRAAAAARLRPPRAHSARRERRSGDVDRPAAPRAAVPCGDRFEQGSRPLSRPLARADSTVVAAAAVDTGHVCVPRARERGRDANVERNRAGARDPTGHPVRALLDPEGGVDVSKVRIALAIATVSLAGLAFAGVTSAAGSWTPISGTVYSDGTWYTSTNVRTIHSGNTAVKVQFTQLPNGNLAFYVRNYNTGIRIGSIIYAPPTTTQTLGNASSGTQFVNVFKEQNVCHLCGWNYNFAGSEYY